MVNLVAPNGEVRKEFELNLDEIAREGAKRMLRHCLNLEVEEYINRHKNQIDEEGHRLVVKNGSGRPRKVTVGSGAVEESQPRVNDKRKGEKFFLTHFAAVFKEVAES